MIEEWRDIVGYEGLYQVSSLGKVRNSRGKILSSGIGNKGYEHVYLYKNQKKTTYNVHILVAKAFLGPCPIGHVVDHKNDLKILNTVRNLHYVPHSYNLSKGRGNELFCIRGHEFTTENTRIHANGNRQCKMCERLLRLNRSIAERTRK